MAKEQSPIPTGRVRRMVEVGRLSTRISAKVLSQKVKGLFQDPDARAEGRLAAQIESARQVVETMGHLKGAVMKVGQMLSLHDGDDVPAEVSSVLSELQSKAPQVPFERMRQQFIASFDKPPEQLFASFDPNPIGAASLGQVYKAALPDGVEVAVKVQYPDIDRTIVGDLQNLRGLIDATGIVSKRFDTGRIFKEIEARLTEEADYLNEAMNLIAFKALFANDPRVVVPAYYPQFSSETIITMDLVRGKPLQEVLDGGIDQAARDKLGRDLFDLFMTQLLDFRVIHADPHHGNFLYLDDGRIALLDFGCVKRFSQEFVDAYKRMARAAIAGDKGALIAGLVDVGFLADDSNPKANALMCELTELFMAPFLEDRPFDFGEADLHLRGRDIPMKVLALGRSSFPPDALYLNRVFVGQYFLLRKLKAKQNWRRVIEPHL